MKMYAAMLLLTVSFTVVSAGPIVTAIDQLFSTVNNSVNVVLLK